MKFRKVHDKPEHFIERIFDDGRIVAVPCIGPYRIVSCIIQQKIISLHNFWNYPIMDNEAIA